MPHSMEECTARRSLRGRRIHDTRRVALLLSFLLLAAAAAVIITPPSASCCPRRSNNSNNSRALLYTAVCTWHHAEVLSVVL